MSGLTGVMAPKSEQGQFEVTAIIAGLGWILAESSMARTWMASAPEP